MILDNPRLATHLRSFDILNILDDFPSCRTFIYHSPILLEKMRFDFPILPDELKLQISKHLPRSDFDALATTCYSSLALFKPDLITNQLLKHVVLNHATQVVNLLSKYGDLIYRRGKVEDSAGRIFNNISAFEYAVWAHDSSMLANMLNSVPPADCAHLCKILKIQYKEMMTSGVSYILSGQVITEPHINVVNTLIEALNNFLSLYKLDMHAESAQCWVKDVGGSQKLLPMHMIDDYCLKSLQNSSKQPDAHLISERRLAWFSKSSELGDKKAIYVLLNGMALTTALPRYNYITYIERNLNELKMLWTTRLTECALQIKKINAELENNLTPEFPISLKFS